METTVTGLFPDSATATRARQDLLAAGFPPEAITTLTRETKGLHDLLGEETSDALRGAAIGAGTGAVGLAVAAAAMSPLALGVFEAHWALAAPAGAAIGGAIGGVIGFLIGSATGHQVQEQYEVLIENGAQALAVNTDGRHAAIAFETLRRAGGVELSTSVHRKSHVRATA